MPLESGFIYKITSPSKRVYIGQSLNYKKRFAAYKCLQCKKQPKLYRSLLKHGVYMHKFEVIAECDIDNLNNLERYYQELFNCLSVNGLNLVLQKSDGKSGMASEESKAKMSVSRSKVCREKQALGLMGWTDEHRRKITEYRLQNPLKHTEEAKKKMSDFHTGKKMSEESKAKMSSSSKVCKGTRTGMLNTESHKLKQSISRKKLYENKAGCRALMVLNTQTGIYYTGAKESISSMGKPYSYPHFNDMLSGKINNKSSFVRA